MADQQNVTVLIRCRNLPGTRFGGRTSLRLGIQKGKQVVEDVPADVDGVTFAVPFRVAGSAESGPPNFLGEFAYGTPEARFIYFSWGERVGEGWDIVRRAKIPLRQWGWEQLQQSWATGIPVEVTVDMTDDKGGPICGSVKM